MKGYNVHYPNVIVLYGKMIMNSDLIGTSL